LPEVEMINHPKIGTLEAFVSNGCRTLLRNIKATNLKEKTLRYKGHVELMNILKISGFLNEKEIEINGEKIIPLEVTAKLLES